MFRSSQAGVVFVEKRDRMENRRGNYCLRSGNGVGRACLVTPTVLPGRRLLASSFAIAVEFSVTESHIFKPRDHSGEAID